MSSELHFHCCDYSYKLNFKNKSLLGCISSMCTLILHGKMNAEKYKQIIRVKLFDSLIVMLV